MKFPESLKISRRSFDNCVSEMSSYLDLQHLSGFLLKYEIIQYYDVEYLSSPHYRPYQERSTSLMKMVEKIGRCGFPLLYVCLKESSLECRGHEDIVDQLLKHCKLFVSECCL